MKPALSHAQIVGLGDLAADIIVRVPELPFDAGAVHVVEPFEVEPGGTGNFLITAQRLGVSAAAFGGIGSDLWGQEIRRILLEENIDLDGTFELERSTTVLALGDHHGRHGLIGSFGHATEGVRPEPCWGLAEADVIYVSGYSLQEEHGIALVKDALAKSPAGTCVWLFDPGPLYGAIDSSVAGLVLDRADVVFVTEGELAAVAQRGPSELVERGVTQIVVKQGADGCQLYGTVGLEADIAGHKVDVADATGAGESFAAGYAVGVVRGWEPVRCARFANAVGAAKVRKVGTGRSMPTAVEVEQLVAAYDVFDLNGNRSTLG